MIGIYFIALPSFCGLPFWTRWTTCLGGGIGRRAGFKIQFPRECGFDSHPRYFLQNPLFFGVFQDFVSRYHLSFVEAETVAGHVTGHVSKHFFMARLYSDPKLFIPKETKGNRKVPSVLPGKKWYVYFYYTDPDTGTMRKQPFKVYLNINRYKTVRERKAYGKVLVRVVAYHLANGYNPFLPGSAKNAIQDIPTISEAFTSALKDRTHYLKPVTYKSYEDYLRLFLQWLEAKGSADKPISELTQASVVEYINYLGRPKPQGKGLKPTSVHNHKLNLSAIFRQVVKNGWAEKNFIAEIETAKNKPERNEPFTREEISRLRDYLQSLESPAMFHYFQFLFYSFLRNREIVQLQAGHIDMENRLISIETKGEKLSRVRIVQPLYELLDSWNLDALPSDFYLLAPQGVPGRWETGAKPKVAYFSKQFARIRQQLGISENKKTYSLRHNAAIELFMGFVESGLTEKEAVYQMLPITRHKDESALRNYLRDLGSILPNDWTEKYRVSF